MQQFLLKYDLVCPRYRALPSGQKTDNLTANNGVQFWTYCNEKLGIYTEIDYICASSNLLNAVQLYDSVNSVLNHSDHLPLEMSLIIKH